MHTNNDLLSQFRHYQRRRCKSSLVSWYAICSIPALGILSLYVSMRVVLRNVSSDAQDSINSAFVSSDARDHASVLFGYYLNAFDGIVALLIWPIIMFLVIFLVLPPAVVFVESLFIRNAYNAPALVA